MPYSHRSTDETRTLRISAYARHLAFMDAATFIHAALGQCHWIFNLWSGLLDTELFVCTIYIVQCYSFQFTAIVCVLRLSRRLAWPIFGQQMNQLHSHKHVFWCAAVKTATKTQRLQLGFIPMNEIVQQIALRVISEKIHCAPIQRWANYSDTRSAPNILRWRNIGRKLK